MGEIPAEIIERAAVNEFNRIIGQDHRLSSGVNVMDKGPVLDGHVYVYSNGQTRKNDDLRFALDVQVKGYTQEFGRKGPRYSFKRSWIEYYSRNDGALFFVVEMNNDATEVKNIYYRSFTPVEAKIALKGFREKAQSKTLKLQRLSKNGLFSLMNTFYEDGSVMNRSTPIVALDEIKELKDVSVSFAHGVSPMMAASDEIRVMGIQDGLRVFVDLSDALDFRLITSKATKVSFPNGVVLEGVWNVSKSEVTLNIGDSVELLFIIQGDGGTLTINWDFPQKINGNIRKKVMEMKALADLRNTPVLFFRDEDGSADKLDLPIDGSGRKSLESLEKYAESLERINWLEDIFGVSLDTFDDEDKTVSKKINGLLSLYTPSKIQLDKIPQFLKMTIQDNDYYFTFKDGELKSFFESSSLFEKEDMVLGTSDGKETLKDANLFVLVQGDYLKIPQYNIQAVLDSNKFKVNKETPEWYSQYYSRTTLSFIDAYDYSGEEKWLFAAESFIENMGDMGEEGNERKLLNLAQIILRKDNAFRPNFARELNKILSESKYDMHVAGAALLFDDIDAFNEAWQKMDFEQRTSIKQSPIIKIASQQVLDLAN